METPVPHTHAPAVGAPHSQLAQSALVVQGSVWVQVPLMQM